MEYVAKEELPDISHHTLSGDKQPNVSSDFILDNKQLNLDANMNNHLLIVPQPPAIHDNSQLKDLSNRSKTEIKRKLKPPTYLLNYNGILQSDSQ